MVIKKILLAMADPVEAIDIVRRFDMKNTNKGYSVIIEEKLRLDICFTGYGCCLAAANLAYHLLHIERYYNMVINSGFAGILKPDIYPLYAVTEVTKVHKFIPNFNHGNEKTEAIIQKAFPSIDCPETTLGSVLMTSDSPLSFYHSGYRLHDADLVDMEGYGIASLAITLNIPFKLIKIGSDRVNHPNDQQILRKQPEIPAQALGKWFEEYLFTNDLFRDISYITFDKS
ncbi:MAG: hypothetical protein RSB82_02540 [Victivallaceae bacterium]